MTRAQLRSFGQVMLHRSIRQSGWWKCMDSNLDWIKLTWCFLPLSLTNSSEVIGHVKSPLSLCVSRLDVGVLGIALYYHQHRQFAKWNLSLFACLTQSLTQLLGIDPSNRIQSVYTSDKNIVLPPHTFQLTEFIEIHFETSGAHFSSACLIWSVSPDGFILHHQFFQIPFRLSRLFSLYYLVLLSVSSIFYPFCSLFCFLLTYFSIFLNYLFRRSKLLHISPTIFTFLVVLFTFLQHCQKTLNLPMSSRTSLCQPDATSNWRVRLKISDHTR